MAFHGHLTISFSPGIANESVNEELVYLFIIILLDSAQNFKGRVKELTMLPLLQIYFDLL